MKSNESDDLLRRVDALLGEDVGFEPEDLGEEPQEFRNFSNGYGTKPPIAAYNADFQSAPPPEPAPQQYRDFGSQESDDVIHSKPKKKGPGCCGCGCGMLLVVLGTVVVCLVAAVLWLFEAPASADTIGVKKPDTATVLLCGTDWEGARTDTMMLLYLSGSEKQVGLLSLPRDTYTITARGNAAKLNSAYGRNGSGAEGMEGLLDYVQEIIGYRPDGYVLVDMDLVPKLVDTMGGVTVDVPQSFELEGETLEEGVHHLTGSQVLQLLRFRSGYAMQDLGRVEVQRQVIQACMEQWVSLQNLGKIGQALELVEEYSLSSLHWRNYLWMGKAMLLSGGSIENDTLPGYATYRGGVSYYVLYRNQVAELVNQRYNPYQVTIEAEDLTIAE